MAKEMLETCPHCSVKLSRWRNPDVTSWGFGYQLVCFNDECTYYKEGWQWMKDNYNVIASYRFRFNPENGEIGPLPVYSPKAGKLSIIQEEDEQPS
ncbi:MAG: hypothetical protein ABIK28_16225 [Planctomycetota bacterium]